MMRETAILKNLKKLPESVKQTVLSFKGVDKKLEIDLQSRR
jgi:hypothetical protein